jgi:hypothetical protein
MLWGCDAGVLRCGTVCCGALTPLSHCSHRFVLKDGFIYNLANKEDLKPFDVVYMEDAVVELTEEKPLNLDSSNLQSFSITTAGRSCVVCGNCLKACAPCCARACCGDAAF